MKLESIWSTLLSSTPTEEIIEFWICCIFFSKNKEKLQQNAKICPLWKCSLSPC